MQVFVDEYVYVIIMILGDECIGYQVIGGE